MVENEDGLHDRVARLTSTFRPGEALTSLAALPGGHSSRTYLAETSAGDLPSFVVKVAPAGVPPKRNRDVLRQARVLRALTGAAGLAVPEVLFADEGAPDDVPPLFAMTYVAGDCLDPALDVLQPEELPPPGQVRRRALDAAAMLASLHAADPAVVGLGDEPETSLSEEIQRWDRLLETITDRQLIAGAEEIGARLRKTVPAAVPSRLLHGDFRLGNTLCAGDHVVAVIDWEIWSRGDPRTDLAWFLLSAQPERHPSALRTDVGFPPATELIEVYGGGISPPELGWFQALQLYKMTAAVSLIAKNLARHGGDEATLARTQTEIPRMITGAAELLD
jgi:aminoglycoside phosphotransferase (APT) family kinase protein